MNYIPFGLRDSHTSADLKEVSDQSVYLQVPSSARVSILKELNTREKEKLNQTSFGGNRLVLKC
jgi:hypothetical protein